ncbi:MAG: dienelactone hydrolase family protein [Proteobacteria bacterium]|nr:dienelactone hydrolase family protein [Pseudomonadota bacterium]
MTIESAEGEKFSAYLNIPASSGGPGVIVLQEIFGVNYVMRDIVDGLAGAGYMALCPDLFWRQEPGLQISDKTEAEWKKAFELYQGFDEDKGIEDAIAALRDLRARDGSTGKVGTVGYCLGGKLAYLMATRSDADCSVSYYGVGIEQALDEKKNITKPLLMHIAEEDGFVPKEAQASIKDALGTNPLITIHSYPGVDHAFARIGGENYNGEAADLAGRRTTDFFQTSLA